MKTLIAINSVAFAALFVMAAMLADSTERRLREEQASRVSLEQRVLNMDKLLNKMDTMLKKAGYTDQEYWR